MAARDAVFTETQRRVTAALCFLVTVSLLLFSGWGAAVLALVLFAVAVLLLKIVHVLGSPARWKRILTDRPEFTEDEFFDMYYKDSGIPKETVLECLQEAANGAEVDASRIRATDRFEVEYDPMPGDGWYDLSLFLKDKMKAAGVKEIAQLQSVDELIRCVWRLETMAKQRGGSHWP